VGDLSAHFDMAEGACPDGCGFGTRREDYPPSTVQLVEEMRGLLGRPVHVNSWCRCQRQNALDGGVPNSAHLRGDAVDIRIAGGLERYDVSITAVLAALRRTLRAQAYPIPVWLQDWRLIEFGLRGLGLGKGFVHVDTDLALRRPSAWGYGLEGGGG
jgi:hypothetical protein